MGHERLRVEGDRVAAERRPYALPHRDDSGGCAADPGRDRVGRSARGEALERLEVDLERGRAADGVARGGDDSRNARLVERPDEGEGDVDVLRGYRPEAGIRRDGR